jgi:hypothetical protein
MRCGWQGDFMAWAAAAAVAWPVRHNKTVTFVRFYDMLRRQSRGWRMTVKQLMITAALVALASPAMAGSYVSTWGCKYSGYYGYNNCRSTRTWVRDPVRDPEQQRLDAIERRKEETKWDEVCKPTFRTDEYGIRRAFYAKQGCEFGRTE